MPQNWVKQITFLNQDFNKLQDLIYFWTTQLDVGFPCPMFSFYLRVSVQSWSGHKQFETHCNLEKHYAIVC